MRLQQTSPRGSSRYRSAEIACRTLAELPPAWGAKGYRFGWKRGRTDSACHVGVVAQGTGKLPAVPAFAHGMGIAPPETS